MRPRADDRTPAGLLAAARGGERRAAARLLTIVEHGGPAAEEVAEATHPLSGGAHVVGITGAPGSGKSTLVGVLATRVAEAGGRPAVVAVDPSSPLTGGAILGDRVRMEAATAAGAFIRSVATRGHGGGLALSVPGSVRVLDACGFDPIVVETVGVGQVEVDVAAAAGRGRRQGDEAGRGYIPVTIFGTSPDPDNVSGLEQAGVDRVLFTLPSEDREKTLPLLDKLAAS